jgi:hypothetical protein
LLGGAFLAAGDHHASALAREGARRGQANAAAPARDQRHLVAHAGIDRRRTILFAAGRHERAE